MPRHTALAPHIPADKVADGDERGGSGVLPDLPHVQWERRTDRPAISAWHAPQGNHAPRNTKTYLGYVSKKLLAEWTALPADECRAVVMAWIRERRTEKGIA